MRAGAVMSETVINSKKRYIKAAVVAFLFTIVVAPWFGAFHFTTRFCTDAIFSNRLQCLDSLASFGRVFLDLPVGLTFVYVYFGIGSFLIALVLAVYCYLRGRIGWKFPLVVATLAIAKEGIDLSRLLWRVDIKNAQHAWYVFGTSALDVLYVSLLGSLFWLLMTATVFGFKHDPHHS
jgi:hypothetical protein